MRIAPSSVTPRLAGEKWNPKSLTDVEANCGNMLTVYAAIT